MLLMNSQHPQRRRRSRPRVFCAFIEAQRRALTDDGAEGIRPRMLKGCVFNTFTRSNRHVYAEQPMSGSFSP